MGTEFLYAALSMGNTEFTLFPTEAEWIRTLIAEAWIDWEDYCFDLIAQGKEIYPLDDTKTRFYRDIMKFMSNYMDKKIYDDVAICKAYNVLYRELTVD